MQQRTILTTIFLQNVLHNSRKRRKILDDEVEDYYQNIKRKRMLEETALIEEESDFVAGVMAGIEGVRNLKKDGNIGRRQNVDRNNAKNWWTNVYNNWDEIDFKNRFRITRETFHYILNRIQPFIEKTPTNLVPTPIEADRQLALTIYRLAHGCSFPVLSDIFGVSKSLAVDVFNHVVRELMTHLYGEFIKLPITDDEWVQEIKGFIENYEFPCIGAWDGFHVFTATKLKNYYNFKNRYSISNMGLVSYNKRFLNLAVGAPGSTHDARLLRHTNVYKEIMDGKVLPNKVINLGDNYGEIPLVTIGDSAFPRFPWLLKAYRENTPDEKERYYNTKLHSARVVTENAYGMLKGRWRILYKKTEMKLYNLKYVVMACVMLHNLCIATNDPCNPRWKLSVEELELLSRTIKRSESKFESNKNAGIIKNWLWEHT